MSDEFSVEASLGYMLRRMTEPTDPKQLPRYTREHLLDIVTNHIDPAQRRTAGEMLYREGQIAELDKQIESTKKMNEMLAKTGAK